MDKDTIKEALSGRKHINMNEIPSMARKARKAYNDPQSPDTPFEKGQVYSQTLLNRTVESRNSQSRTATDDLSKQFDQMMDLTLSKIKEDPFNDTQNSSNFVMGGKILSEPAFDMRNDRRRAEDSQHMGLKGRTKLGQIDAKINQIFGRDFSNERDQFRKSRNAPPPAERSPYEYNGFDGRGLEPISRKSSDGFTEKFRRRPKKSRSRSRSNPHKEEPYQPLDDRRRRKHSQFSESQFSDERMLDDFDTLQDTINRSKSTQEDRERIRSGSPELPRNQGVRNGYYDPYDDYEEGYKNYPENRQIARHHPSEESFIRIKESQNRNMPPQGRQQRNIPPRGQQRNNNPGHDGNQESLKHIHNSG